MYVTDAGANGFVHAGCRECRTRACSCLCLPPCPHAAVEQLLRLSRKHNPKKVVENKIERDAHVTRDCTVSDPALRPPVAGWATFWAFYSSRLPGWILFPDHHLMMVGLRLCVTFYPLKKSFYSIWNLQEYRKAHKATWPALFAEYGGIFFIVFI